MTTKDDTYNTVLARRLIGELRNDKIVVDSMEMKANVEKNVKSRDYWRGYNEAIDDAISRIKRVWEV
ncbi:hypothetical protein [Weissella cibaria]|uniref:hypothetical protein n=2 Tax=Weissella TaxID=46255 RepID=UPI000E51B3F0|nr:hypothetical protein [Weissella cibaria]MDY2520517.1 hypothetical protein [Weissella cibaria]RHE73787.1 hypothetical protein DW718_00745 [Weissella cibaria]RHE79522.1 hypothetical protein DW717_00745 [Weissella cibaria]HCN26489.1 hypothetical protein [Weissella cibaria]HCU10335.1 hypothetical protein [Weissella cibaria]